MANLRLTNQEIKEQFALVAGVNRDDSSWDPDTTSDFNRMLRAGRRKFFSANQWKFLEQDYTITTAAPEESSTITVVNGVVTRAAGVWAGDTTSLPQEYMLEFSDGLYQIASRDSDTQITLENTGVSADAGTSYKLYKVKYALPTNFAGFIHPVLLENENRYLANTGTFPNFTVEKLLRRRTVYSGRPEAYAISQLVTETSGIPAYYFMLSPLPDDEYVLWTRIRFDPEDTLDFSDSAEVFHSTFSECLMEAVLSATEIYYHGSPGNHTQQFAILLQQAIKKDREMRGVSNLRSRRRAVRDPNYELRVGRGTYDGVD